MGAFRGAAHIHRPFREPAKESRVTESNKDNAKSLLRRRIDADVADFLAGGGKITKVRTGATAVDYGNLGKAVPKGVRGARRRSQIQLPGSCPPRKPDEGEGA